MGTLWVHLGPFGDDVGTMRPRSLAGGDVLLQLLDALLVLLDLPQLLLDLRLHFGANNPQFGSVPPLKPPRTPLFPMGGVEMSPIVTSVSTFFLSSRSSRSWSAFWSRLNFSSS